MKGTMVERETEKSEHSLSCGMSKGQHKSEDPHICGEESSSTQEMFELLRIDVDSETLKIPRTDSQDSSCSRNVLRKQKNWEKTLAAKKGKRREEKQRRKLKRIEESGNMLQSSQHSKRVVKAITKERLIEAKTVGPRLCIDLSMTDLMSHKEISRLAGQIRRLYGSNRKAANPFHLYLTGLREDGLLYKECLRKNDGFLNYVMDVTEDSWLDLFPLDSVIYLTPDSEHALEHVDPDKVYILGGLVDESIQKITYQKAMDSCVCTARLPIQEYMVKKTNAKNFHSKILAINQVFDILLTFCETQSWPEALKAGVPPGKGYVLYGESAPDAHLCAESALETL
ncbi:tRNA methyltransferase 10 homolog B isoform X2 [Lepisosteus oculatus]|uniref:tRNA methyltransferase 10 homolog B isoform X2 n=1 Tax=Lepisosteus oculatus TaxID=7918 RepID=UPI00073FF4DB|nr:PREDICTED: tRNA methyltransferase 10 homolog B isoform X2 [Lepisosteus oculatus]